MADTVDRAGVAGTVRRITSGRLTAVAAVEECLAVIGRRDHELNAMSVVLAEQARAEAAARDAALASGEAPGPLHGVPLVVKEEMAVAGTVTTFGGLGNHTPAAADGEVVRRLRAAGAVVVGKTRMPEFGAFPYTESDAHGVTRNPWLPTRTPGGSSGGSAVAVATGMAEVATAGDGGGSIRVPAAWCGLFGLKPQRGRVTTAPAPHLWWALGTAGPLTRSVLDSAIVYDVIRGNTPTDRYRAEDTGSFVSAAGRPPGRLRIGWSVRPAALGVRPHPLQVRVVEETARLLADLGHDVRPVEPHYPDGTAAFLPQFFGAIRAEAAAVDDVGGLEDRTRETCRLGRFTTPRVLEWGLQQTEAVSRKANRVFDPPTRWGQPGVDVLLTPATANRPPRVGILTGAGTVRSILRSFPAVAYAALWNVAGNPAAAVPRGLGPDGLPTSVQLVGRPHDEPTLLSLAAQLEEAQPWPLLVGEAVD